MADSSILHRVLIAPWLFVLRLVTAIIYPPISLLISILLFPFRFLYAFFGSLWWVLPSGSRHASTNPPTPSDFLLASLLIGLIAGMALYITSRILFALPDLLGITSAASGKGQKLVPSGRQVQKRIREQANKVQLLQEIKPDPMHVANTSGPSRSVVSDARHHRVGQPRMQEHGSEEAIDWEDKWQQQYQDLSPRSQISPALAISPSVSRDAYGVAGQTIVEESSDDEDIDYFD